jgi:hypothetical protein
VAQAVEHLLCKCDTLSSTPSLTQKRNAKESPSSGNENMLIVKGQIQNPIMVVGIKVKIQKYLK